MLTFWPRATLDIWDRLLKSSTETSGMSGYVDPALLDGSSAYNSWHNPTAHVPPISNQEPTIIKDADDEMGDLFGDVPAAPAGSVKCVSCGAKRVTIANWTRIGQNREGQTETWMRMALLLLKDSADTPWNTRKTRTTSPSIFTALFTLFLYQINLN